MDQDAWKDGSSFYVRTLVPWQQGDCSLHANTAIEGRIVPSDAKDQPTAKPTVKIQFAAVPCFGQESLQVLPVLVALRAAVPAVDNSSLGRQELVQAMSSMVGSHAPSGASAQRGTSMQTGASGAWQMVGQQRTLPTQPEVLKTGEVKDIGGVKLVLPAAGSLITTLVSKHGVVLNKGTEFALVMVTSDGRGSEKGSATRSEPPAATPVEKAAAPPPPSPIEPPEVCAVTGCKQLDTTALQSSGHAVWRVSLKESGLKPRLQQLRLALDDDASVHFLGEDQVLVAFNPHQLTRRSTDEDASPRIVEALVFSRADGRLIARQEWNVHDGGRYIWDLGDGRVLANVDRGLSIFGPGLVQSARFELPGPLVFASSSPVSADGNMFVSAVTLREKHTPELHRRLIQYLGAGYPMDEDYDLTLLNSKLEKMGTQTLNLEPAPVALLSSGMVSAQHEHEQRWSVVEQPWDGAQRVLAKLDSSCDMDTASLPGSLLFISGCGSDAHANVFRVLNDHGATLLKGITPETSLVQQVESSRDGGTVAVATTTAGEPIHLKSGVRVSDFAALGITVYQVSSGKPIFHAKSAGGSALRQTFALSPAGNSLAILSGSTLEAFTVPTTTR